MIYIQKSNFKFKVIIPLRHAPAKQTNAGSTEAVKPVGCGDNVVAMFAEAAEEELETNGTPFKS